MAPKNWKFIFIAFTILKVLVVLLIIATEWSASKFGWALESSVMGRKSAFSSSLLHYDLDFIVIKLAQI